MRFFDLTLPTIEENLALDEAALLEVESGALAPHVRLWELDRPAVVLGASGRILDDVDVERCRADGVPIARRSSGGGTVVLGPGAPSFSVVLPRDAAPGLDLVDRAQSVVLGRLASEVPGLTVEGSGDLAAGGRKVSGSAQRRLKFNLLIHATILLDFDLTLISRYTKAPKRQPTYRLGRSHEDFVANLGISRSDLAKALRRAWSAVDTDPSGLGGAVAMVPRLLEERFADPLWVGRV